ncbi:recombinase family protein [Sebaldella sp. S0638]|uniref:recombinase family protein n=1 Tax=Sebaldella sp. S0638 TaxID=2957809 RepID=UPI00209E0217|nr:recombinase family protein [Sebaldella sp. S0638]MCP1224063.1 recombinase family protein [Sebaldella sp. S0638]
MGKIFGYARISKTDQNLDLQKDSILNYGAQVIYEEKNSGKNTNRPELTALLKAASSSDTIVVYKLDRISRSTRHLIELAEYFEKNGIQFVSITDFIDTSTPTGRFFFHVMASIAELERDILIERTQAGLSSARLRGRVGGRPKTKMEKIKRAIKLYEGKEYSIKEIKEMTGVSKSVLYRNLKSLKEKS